MAKIFDVPQSPVQRSMVGSPYETVSRQAPDFMERDTARREVAGPLSNAIAQNPNYPPGFAGNDMRNYFAGGLPYDSEGLLTAVALKYGIDAAKQLVEKMPTMSRSELMAIYKLVQGAAREADSMDDRERMAYERAGMQYRQGQYVPK